MIFDERDDAILRVLSDGRPRTMSQLQRETEGEVPEDRLALYLIHLKHDGFVESRRETSEEYAARKGSGLYVDVYTLTDKGKAAWLRRVGGHTGPIS